MSITHRLQDSLKYPIIGERYVKVMEKQLSESAGEIDVSLLDMGRKGLAIISVDKKTNAAFPIIDYSGGQIGVMLIDMNVSCWRDMIRYITFTQILILFLVASLAGVLSLMLLSKTILKPISEIIIVSQKMSQGDLTQSVAVNQDDEIGWLSRTMNIMIDKVRGMVAKIIEVVTQLTLNIDDISRALQDQAASASQQSASVSEITSTMAEFSASSKQIAEHADTVLKTAEQALEAANTGAESVALVTGKMEEIDIDNHETVNGINALGAKTREITKIMEIINNIADQTKLIAFNAALEASSAGEAGKRFGVVAVEIRRLAESVELSTRETEEKISEIQEAVSNMIMASEKKTSCIKDGISFFIPAPVRP